MKSPPAHIRKIYAVPHFHFDLEWWKVKSGYATNSCRIMRKAVQMLKAYPHFRYTVDQVEAFRPFWDKHPEERAFLQQAVNEGRVEMVGGTLAAPDENLPLGESLIRQYLLGKTFVREHFGQEVVTGWEIDCFGHPRQLPQILRKCGFLYFAFARGMQPPFREHPILFHWEAPDGSRVLTWWMAAHYSGFPSVPAKDKILFRLYTKELEGRLDYEGRRSPTNFLPIPFGTDFTVPTDAWIRFASSWNEGQKSGAVPDRPPIEFATPQEVFARVDAKTLATMNDDLNPVFTGCYESRMKLKKLARRHQHRLLALEKLVASLPEEIRPDLRSNFRRAWSEVVQNDFHDILCGTGTDAVYRSALDRYAKAQRIADGVESRAFAALASYDQGGRQRLALFHPLNWPEEVVVSLPWAGVSLQQGNRKLPAQTERGKSLVRVPLRAMELTCLELVPQKKAAPPFKVSLENRVVITPHLHVHFDPAFRGIARVSNPEGRTLLKADGRMIGEPIAYEDAGNLWTIQETGASTDFTAAEREAVVEATGPVRCVVRTVFRVPGLKMKTRYVFYPHRPYLDIEYDFASRLSHQRLQALFPRRGQLITEAPFHALERDGDGIFPVQMAAALQEAEQGYAILTRGNPSVEARGSQVAVTLIRSVGLLPASLLKFLLKNRQIVWRSLREAYRLQKEGLWLFEWALYPIHGLMLREWASKGAKEWDGAAAALDHLLPFLRGDRPASLEHGRHRFRLRLFFYRGDYKQAGVFHEGWAFNAPPIGRLGRFDPKTFPRSHWPEKDKGAIAVAFKMAEDGQGRVLRVYDPYGEGSALEASRVGQAQLTPCDMLERPTGRPVTSAAVPPWAIESYRVP